MPTPLKNLFLKPIERTIEGVIKADDNQSLRQEIEEYVLTNEVAKRLEDFLSAYLNYAGANGVWISGFFGSGKSHLLKILAHLLENKSVEGTPVLELFLPKCPEDNELLKKDLMRAVAIPSQSILFNIDQKADIISKTQIDALLTVFVKVFDETCGYYGKQGHIAQFERDLDSRKLFVPFKQAFQTLAGLPWERGREQALLEAKNIAQAYAEATGDSVSAVGILDKYRAEYKVSIEDFADKVNAYLEQHPPQFRLNFFVDEVGQYIADNTKLMTNLQTIAESLATRCKGRAWIIVTAQEDMHTVMGEMTQKQGNDFTKIQARFANRMKLTSQDVAEVIQKRLLAKNDAGIKISTALYQQEVNNLKTLFEFNDNSTTYRNYRDQNHFVDCYPFVPYQFPLFQSAIQALSVHNAFEGRHSSVGERSMLGVFKQVAERISNHEPGQLASFDLMYEGLSTALKSNNKRAIDHVAKHLDNPLALRLIKVLFLVKYIKGFKGSLHNLTILLLDHFETDLPQLRKSLEAALLLLEQQTLIQRNGELYEFLTDEEKDIEQEIKNQEVDQSKVAEELKTLCFDSVLKVSNKIRFIDNGQDYTFAKKLDDQLFGKDAELTVHVISPFHEHATDETLLQMQSMGRNELLVVMPADDRLVRDLWLYARTDKYLRQNLSTAQQDSVKQILTNKKLQNGNRLADLQKLVESLLGKARLFVAGNAIEESSEQAQTRIFKGFYALINRTYPNLKMLRGVTYSERDLGNYLNPDKSGLLGGDYDPISEAEQEMLAFVQGNQRQSLRTSVKAVVERFERKPYGWYYAAILCILAKLCAQAKLEVRHDGQLLDGTELEKSLGNSNLHGHLLLDPQIDFTAAQVRALKSFYDDFFDSSAPSSEAKPLAQATAAEFKKWQEDLQTKYLAHVRDYPFLAGLEALNEAVTAVVGKPYAWYLGEFAQLADTLLDLKENVFIPIRNVFKGPQKAIFDQARQLLREQKENIQHLTGDEFAEMTNLLIDPGLYKGNKLQKLKTLTEGLQTQLNTLTETELQAANTQLLELQSRLTALSEYGRLNAEQQDQVLTTFAKCQSQLAQQTLIAVMRDSLRSFEDKTYPQLLAQIAQWAEAPAVAPKEVTEPEGQTVAPPKLEPTKPIVVGRSIKVEFDKAWLTNESDVDAYLQLLRRSYLAEIKQGKRIQV